MLVGLDEGSPKGIQKNEWMRVFFPSEDGQTDLSLIKEGVALCHPFLIYTMD